MPQPPTQGPQSGAWQQPPTQGPQRLIVAGVVGAAVLAVGVLAGVLVARSSEDSSGSSLQTPITSSSSAQIESKSAEPTQKPADYPGDAELLCDALYEAAPDSALAYPIIGDYPNTRVPENAPAGTYADCWIYTKTVTMDTHPSGGSYESFEYVQLRAQIGGDHQGLTSNQLLESYINEGGADCTDGADDRSGKFDKKPWVEMQCMNQIGQNIMTRVIQSDGVEFVVEVMRAQSSGVFTLDDFDPIADQVLDAVI